jgi:probable O-glycosylation ligase (exosortase A-associated)
LDQNFSRILAVAMLLGWAARGCGNWNFGRAKGAVLALVAFMAWAMVSAALAPRVDVAWGFVENMLKIVLPVLVGVTVITSTKQIRQLAWVIALSQGYVAYDLNVSYFEGFNRLQVVGFGGMDNNCNAIAMVAGVGFAFFLGLEDKLWWRKLVAFGAAALMAHTICFSFSRGGMLALIIMALVSFVLIRKTPKHIAWFAMGLVLAAMMAGKEVRERFSSAFVDEKQRDESAQSRVDMWQNCWNVILKNPITGAGPDHWPFLASEYGWTAGKEAHSMWLQLGAELGLAGPLLLFAFYGLTVRKLWPYARGRVAVRDPWARDVAQMVIASTVGFIIAVQFVSLEGLEIPYYVAMCGLAGLAVESRGGVVALEVIQLSSRTGKVASGYGVATTPT